jgi:hypothetical protein
VALAQIALTMQVKALALLVSAALLWPASLPAERVAVRHTEGLVHGFLALRNMAGMTLADGELLQEGPMFQDGPIWRIELVSPVWKK